jgi:hypothetical protein
MYSTQSTFRTLQNFDFHWKKVPPIFSGRKGLKRGHSVFKDPFILKDYLQLLLGYIYCKCCKRGGGGVGGDRYIQE